MKKNLSKRIVIATILGLTIFGGICTENPAHAEATQNTTVAVNVQVQQEAKGNIDWTKGAESEVIATGIGLPPENMGSRVTPLARRAAIVDAYRNLAETIQGVQVDSDTVMQDLVIQSDTVRAQVSALIKGAKIIEEGQNADGSYFVRMSVPLYGAGNSVAAIAIPGIVASNILEPLPAVEKTSLPERQVEEIRSSAYTGVIVNASGLGLESTFSPVIYDENGRGIYGIKNINPDFAISQGMVSYARNMNQAMADSRIGSNPLVVNALAVRGGRNSANKVNVVITINDGDRILLANEKSGMLQNCAVVFVK